MDSAQFVEQILVELRRARDLHPAIASEHEGYAVILEELDEVWAAVKSHPITSQEAERRESLILLELVQVAAMCARMAEDLYG